jgi:predicted PurR-regulated permease PerM
METVYFGLGALTVMVVILITVVVIGAVRLKNVLQELRQERDVRRENTDNIWREFQNIERNFNDSITGTQKNLLDDVSLIHRSMDSRFDQLINLIDKK